MTIKKHLSFVCGVVLAFLCMGCETPTGAGSLPINVVFKSQFIVENNSSTKKSISLKKAYHYSDAWDIRSEAGLEADSPVNVEALPGEDCSLTTRARMPVTVACQSILSFVLTIDDKHYVGWPATTGDGGLERIVEHDLGYVNVMPGEFFGQGNLEFVLLSKLTPKMVEHRVDTYVVVALYGVRITDEGVSFVLYRQTVI
jgi:hypothetical protein